VLCFCPLPEIEAKEACDWLRAAGFPQYAQLYEGRRLGLRGDFVALIQSKHVALFWDNVL